MTLKEIVTLPYPAKISHAIAGVLYYQINPKPITLMRYIRKAIDSGELVIATTDAEV